MTLSMILTPEESPRPPDELLAFLSACLAQRGLPPDGFRPPDAAHPLFVERDVLADLARQQNCSLRQVMDECLSRHIWPERFRRNYGLFSVMAMRRLLGARVLLAGCGGLGGHLAGMLARLGVGAFVLCDPDSFTESNLNRQAFCTERTLGRPKAEVAAETVRDIAGYAEVTPHVLAVTADNLPALLAGVDVALDCLDSVADKSLLESACLRAGVSFVHGGVLRHEGMVFRNVPEPGSVAAGTSSMPGALPAAGLGRLYPQGQSPAELDAARAAGVSVLSVAGTACLMAGQCLRILLGEAAPGLGRLYHLDSGIPELESFAW